MKERHVYVIEAVGHDAVKIGVAEHPLSRLYELQKATFVELRLMRCSLNQSEGATEIETRLRRKFAAHRIRGEWFRLSAIRAELLRARLS